MPYVLLVIALFVAVAVRIVTAGPWRPIDTTNVTFAARQPLLDGVADTSAWPTRREALLAALETHVYGPEPGRIEPRVVQRDVIAPSRAGGIEGVEQWQVDLGAAGSFHLVLVLPPRPRPRPRPAPVIVVQNFCGNRAAFPGRPQAIAEPLQWYPWICREPAFEPALQFIFGKHLNAPPFKLVAERGYALALVYAGDVVPDHVSEARRALKRFAPASTGALSAWAWVHSRTLDVLLQDDRIDAGRVAVWGQSRNGKAALLAGARDARFAAVVGLQSGRAGDALTCHRSGESVRAITTQFPHWTTPQFARYCRADAPVDQHALLAAVAPRPLLIGHARRDGWADPVGARAALAAAEAVWDLFGAAQPEFFQRPGVHGIDLVDWEVTLDFLDARLKPEPSPGSLPG